MGSGVSGLCTGQQITIITPYQRKKPPKIGQIRSNIKKHGLIVKYTNDAGETNSSHSMWLFDKRVLGIETGNCFTDWQLNIQKALVLGTLAEHSLPMSMAPVLINVAKSLTKDRKALSHLAMDRTTASYKMRFGLAKTFHEQTVSDLKALPFSLNIDESTSNNLHRVLAVLVSYFSPRDGQVVVKHLASLDIVKVDASSLYCELTNLFTKHGIPWKNLISVLMDSCSVMRGSKSGLEVRLRSNKAAHLFDIDGDTCHHIHNASKMFCAEFDFWVEQLFIDLANDFKWSADLRDALKEICELIDIRFTMPERYVGHRWLTCYDVAVSTVRLLDAYKIFYFSFLEKNMKPVYCDLLNDVLESRGVSNPVKNRLKDIQIVLSKKKLTKDGEKRKGRLIERIFFKPVRSMLILNLYIAVLPLLKKYVCLFETKEPLIHKMAEQQELLMTDFLACFVKPQFLQDRSGRGLKKVDLHDSSVLLNVKDIFIGAANRKLLVKFPKDDMDVKAFYPKALAAFQTCGSYMIKKLPLENELLVAVSAIDPAARGNHHSTRLFNKLPGLVKNILQPDEENVYCHEVNRYQIDSCMPPHEDDSGKNIRVDKWWNEVIKSKQYTVLPKIVNALLSCFHGPQVEGSFNVMGDVLNAKSGRMKVETYSAIQTVKYSLRSSGGALNTFTRNDFLHDIVDSSLVRNICSAARCYKEEKNKKKTLQEGRKTEFELKEKPQTKASYKKLSCKTSQKDLETHKNDMARIAKKRRLQTLSELVEKKKKKTN